MRVLGGEVTRMARRIARVLACGLVTLALIGGAVGLAPAPAHAITEGVSEKLQEVIETVGRIALERQEEREAKQAQEQTEARARGVREASERAAAQRATLERSEREASERVPAVACIVPALHGETLHQARIALVRAHCALGHIRRTTRHKGRLVVTAQGTAPGSRLARGAVIGVTLGPTRRRR
jgi:FtsZ-binding cell division protein ZapB